MTLSLPSLPHQTRLAQRLPLTDAVELTPAQSNALEELLNVCGEVAGNWRTVAGLEGFLLRRRHDVSGAGVLRVTHRHMDARTLRFEERLTRTTYYRVEINAHGVRHVSLTDAGEACRALGVDLQAYLAAHLPR